MILKFGVPFLLVCVLFSSCEKEEHTPNSSVKKLYASRGANPGIYDSEGRYMILRGANYNALGDYWQANPNIPTTKPYATDDLRMMAEAGFNCVRLLFSWSKLEPQPGVYDDAYIQSINAVIQEANTYNMYVMLDMHQDAWSKYTATPADTVCEFPSKGWDGAPLWATITDGASTCTVDGSRESAPAVVHAWQNFWDNTNGIQDNCIAAWQHLVAATCTHQNLLGYDLLNEPSLGYKEPQTTEMTKLSDYYGRLISAIRSAEGNASNAHIIFIENPVTYKGAGFLGLPDSDFSTDTNVVAAPHNYFESIGSFPVSIEDGYGFLVSTVRTTYQTTAFVGEWGFFGDPSSDVSKVKRFAAVEDANFGSGTWWQWAQAPGDPHGMNWDGTNDGQNSLHLIEVNQSGSATGVKNELYLKVLGRSRPNAIAGTPTLLTSNPDNGTMHLEATATTEGTTIVWIPNYFGTPTLSGTNSTLKELQTLDGGYLAYVTVNGSYTIDVSF